MKKDKNAVSAGVPGAVSRTGKALARLRAFGRAEGGAAAVLAAVMFPIVIGGMGLGAETGYWYMTQRKLQHAADTSAHAAAVRKMQGDSGDEIEAAALHIADETGFAPELGTLVLNVPPTSGAYVGDENAIEVIVDEVRPRLFSTVVAGFFSDEPQTSVTLGARAVAAIESGSSKACVLALSPDQAGAVTVSGSTDVTLEGCNVASNSVSPEAFRLQGTNAKLTADCVTTVGGANPTTSTRMTLAGCDNEVKVNASAVLDPYAAVPEPQVQGPCSQEQVPASQTKTLQPECYTSLTIMGQVTFDPGVYIITGSMDKRADAVVQGEGVVFYLAPNATLTLNGTATTTLSAPTNGDYSGILFFGSRDSVSSYDIAGDDESFFNGAVYAPGSTVTYKGNSNTDAEEGCTQIIANRIDLTGNSTMKSNCETAGGKDIEYYSVALKE